MAAKTKVTTAPFNTTGGLMHYPADRYDYSGSVWDPASGAYDVPAKRVGPDWRPNVPFAATLRLEGTRRGRSAAYFVWHDEEGREFPMFISDMTDLVRSGTIVAGGVVAERWMVAKRGANYGVQLATAEETAAAVAGSVA